MHSSLLFTFLLLFISFVSCTESKRISDQIYISFNRTRYCVRRLNATHEIGCQSATNGNSGRMYMIDNDQEFDSYITNTKFIDSFGSFIVVLNIDLFNTYYIDKLLTRLDSKLNGLLIYLKSNLTRPEDFTHDDQCPNNRYSYHLNQTETINWNPKGTGLFFRSFPFPIMLIDEEDDYKQLIKFYQQFNSSSSSPACGLELQTFQSAAHTSKTCMRRGGISHSLIDPQETFCDPVSGLNIYSKLPQSLVIQPNKRPEKSVILILTTTDSFQMFLKTDGPTGGAQQPATGLILFLALAHLIGQEQEEFNQHNKEFIFVTLDGDALDYSASYRFMFDMESGYFPNGDKNEERIQFEHIHSVIEFQAMSFTDKLSVRKSFRKLILYSFSILALCISIIIDKSNIY
jgi:nicastrin